MTHRWDAKELSANLRWSIQWMFVYRRIENVRDKYWHWRMTEKNHNCSANHVQHPLVTWYTISCSLPIKNNANVLQVFRTALAEIFVVRIGCCLCCTVPRDIREAFTCPFPTLAERPNIMQKTQGRVRLPRSMTKESVYTLDSRMPIHRWHKGTSMLQQ